MSDGPRDRVPDRRPLGGRPPARRDGGRACIGVEISRSAVTHLLDLHYPPRPRVLCGLVRLSQVEPTTGGRRLCKSCAALWEALR